MLITTVIYCHGLNRLHASSDAVFKLFLDMFTKLWKATIDFVMEGLATCNNSAPTERIFSKFDFWVFFENLLRKF